KQDQIMRRRRVVGQPLRQRDTDRHLHVTGEPAQDFLHQRAFALVQVTALHAISEVTARKISSRVVPCGLAASWASLPMSLMSRAVNATSCSVTMFVFHAPWRAREL